MSRGFYRDGRWWTARQWAIKCKQDRITTRRLLMDPHVRAQNKRYIDNLKLQGLEKLIMTESELIQDFIPHLAPEVQANLANWDALTLDTVAYTETDADGVEQNYTLRDLIARHPSYGEEALEHLDA